MAIRYWFLAARYWLSALGLSVCNQQPKADSRQPEASKIHYNKKNLSFFSILQHFLEK
jgi:hypothetical protein